MLKRLNGLDFEVDVEGSGSPLLLLHGFTGSLRGWDDIRPELAAYSQVIAVDLIGHGRSAAPADPARYTLDWSARDLMALLDALGLDRVVLLGYSMGGRIALHFALHAPGRIRTLILESASPGIEDDAERVRRIASDEALAQRILEHGIEAFVAEWEQQPLLALAPHVTETVRARQRAQRLLNRPLGLANSLLGMGAGQQTPLWSRLGELRVPTHLIVGAEDARYRLIADRILEVLPGAALTIVAEAGHTVHLDQPRHFVRLIRDALDNKLTQPAIRC